MSEVKKRKKRNIYFGKPAEDAVKMFLTATTQHDRDYIFADHLWAPFMKLAENILFSYRLTVPTEDVMTQKIDAVSFLMTKIHKFDPTKISIKSGLPVKAYSYCGTIIKRYYIAKRIKHQKLRNLNFDFVDYDSGTEFSYDSRDDEVVKEQDELQQQIIQNFIKYCEEVTNTGDTSETRVAVAESLGHIIKHADKLPIVNKNFIYFLIREQQRIKLAKDITAAIKILKEGYLATKSELINGG